MKIGLGTERRQAAKKLASASGATFCTGVVTVKDGRNGRGDTAFDGNV